MQLVKENRKSFFKTETFLVISRKAKAVVLQAREI